MTEGLKFVPIDVSHADALFHTLDFDSVYQFITQPRSRNADEVRARIVRVNKGPDPKSGRKWLNFIMLREVEVIGWLQATAHGSSAEIAYLLSPPASGKGYATAGVLWLIEHIHETRGVDEFWACADPANQKSINLLNRCGFHETALPSEGLLSHEGGDAVFCLRRTMDS